MVASFFIAANILLGSGCGCTNNRDCEPAMRLRRARCSPGSLGRPVLHLLAMQLLASPPFGLFSSVTL